MDTKTLHDLAVDAGLFRTKPSWAAKKDAEMGFDDDGYHDAIPVWVDGIMQDPEYLVDLWLDGLSDVVDEKLKSLMIDFGKVNANVRDAQQHGRFSDGLMMTCATTLAHHQSNLGQSVYEHVFKFVEDYVTKYAQEWWKDVTGYHYDMEQGQREDYEYENRKDRRLEE